MRMKTKIIVGMVTALLLASILTMTAFYVSPVKAITIISYSPIELYESTTLQSDYQFIGCDGFIVKNLGWMTLDLNGHKVIGSTPTYGTKGILVNGSEYTGTGEIHIKNGEIEGFHVAIHVYRYGYLAHDNWVYVENIKTKGNNFCAWVENSWVRLSDCSFDERLACIWSVVLFDSDTKVAMGS